MRQNYAESIRRVLLHEGGYTNHPSDPGGPTNFGITIADYRKYVKPGATAADVRNMKLAEAKEIYRTKYWNAQECDELPAGVDYAVFDYGVSSGIGRSAKVLQRVVGVTVDGKIGPATVAAASARDPKVVIAAICDERLAFLKGLRTWSVFGKGWGARVAEVRAYALSIAGAAQMMTPSEAPEHVAGTPPWLARMNAILGLYEFPGGKDNPAVLGMAKACGGNIAKTYTHDSIPWCALTVNYCLIASGLPGNDSLWALDFGKYGTKLPGAAVGAIACKKRSGGGHVFLVIGRTRDGRLVGRGGNQSDMVCDNVFDPSEIVAYTWPASYPKPKVIGFASLPVVTPAPKAHKNVELPAPSIPPINGKGVVPPPTGLKKIVVGGPAATGAASAANWHDWVAAHPWETALIAAGAIVIIGAGIAALTRRHQAQQEAAAPGNFTVSVKAT